MTQLSEDNDKSQELRNAIAEALRNYDNHHWGQALITTGDERRRHYAEVRRIAKMVTLLLGSADD